MPHLTTFGGSYFSTGQLAFEDRLNADLDANDFGLRTKGIIHPNYSPDGVAQRNANDGFQAEGDIKGIIDPNYVTGDGSDQLQQNAGPNYSPWDHDVINASDALTNYRPYEMQAGIGISANARGKTTGTNPDSMRTAGYAEAVGLDSSSLDSFAGDPLVLGGTTLQNYQVPAPDKSLGDCTCDDTLLDKRFGMSSSVMESTGSMDQSQPWLSGEAMDSLDLSQTVRPSVDLF